MTVRASAAPTSPTWATRARALVRRLRRFLRPPRRFPPTREGWWFLAGTLLVGMAAINSGFNLLFFVWGMMLALIVASGVLSEICLRRLEVTRLPPSAVFAGTPFLMGVRARNGKRRLPSFSVEVEDLIDETPVDKRCYFLKLPAQRAQETAYRFTIARRGLFRLDGIRISTRFPFGLIRKSLDIEAPGEILVYPAQVAVAPDLLRATSQHLGREDSARLGRRGEFFGLREFRQGDDPRDIHWRTSARRGRSFVRENEEDSGREIVVALVDGGASGPGLEAAVSLAASIAVELLRRGLRVGLETRAGDVDIEEGPGHAQRCLTFLALWQPDATTAGAPAVDRTRAPGHGRAGRIVVEPAGGSARAYVVGREGAMGGAA